MKLERVVRPVIYSLTAFLLYFPVLIIGILSFNSSSRNFEITGFTLNWFVEIVQDRSLFEAIQRTWMVAVISTVIATIVGKTFASWAGSISLCPMPMIVSLWVNTKSTYWSRNSRLLTLSSNGFTAPISQAVTSRSIAQLA